MLDRDITKLVSIDDICNVSRGASPRPIKNYLTESEEGVPWIKIGDVSPCDKYIKKTNERITQEGAKKSRLLHKGDLILSNSMSFGRPYILEIDGCIHDGWISLSGFENFVLRDFLYEVLNTKCVQDYWTMKANNGGAMSNLNSDIVKSTIIKIPSVKVQEQIVEILNSFTNLIDALNEELSLRQKQFEYYREKLLTFDDNVKRLSFGDDFSLKARIGWQGLTKKEYRKTGDYYLITGTDFKEGNKIDFSTCVYVDEDRYTQDPNIQIKPNDVLITKDGTLGKVAFIERMDKPATLNGGVFVVRSKVNGVHPKYVAYYLSSSIFKNWIEQNHTNGSIMHLTQKMLVNFEIAMPSISIQQSIVEKLDAFESLISSLKEEIALRQKQYEYYREKLLTFD